MSLNRVFLIGNLTRDPELSYTPKGTAVCKVTLAVNRVWTTEGGEKKEECTFIDCEAWARKAEVLAEYVKKGNPLFVEGRMQLERWEDKTTGQKRSKTKVIIESIEFLHSNRTDKHPEEPDSVPRKQKTAPAPTKRPPHDPDLDAPEDDMPF